MSENRKRILEMVAQGKLTIDEAERLIALVEQVNAARNEEAFPTPSRRPPRYLRVVVQQQADDAADEASERVDVRVPLSVIRAGMKLPALLPSGVLNGINTALREKGVKVDVRNLRPRDVDEVIEALSSLEIDVRSGEQRVRVFVE